MQSNHDDIKEKLPEYISDGFMPEEVKAHLKTCKECRDELSILQALKETSVPEPGEMFFETLPQKIRVLLREKKKKSIFLRLVPAFASIALVIAVGYIYHVTNKTPLDDWPLFSDPFASQVYDLDELSADNIPSIADSIKDEDAYLPSGETTFLRELASLSEEEMELLYDNLKTKNKNGGML
jgi:PHP family Zn ribbon phosphoesterase